MATNLIEGIQQECNRCRDLLKQYEHPEIAPTAGFAVAMIQQDIKEGEDSIASGDVGRMIKAFAALKDCK